MKTCSQSQWKVAGACAVLLSLVGGCGGSGGNPHPVESDQARAVLEDVLESWKQGESSESWREKDPEVVIQDMDWKSGAKLKDYEIIDPGKAVDANLHCDVKLTLVDAKGKSFEKTVTYLVGTSPALTVFRKVTM